MDISYEMKEEYLYFKVTGDFNDKKDFPQIVNIVDITKKQNYSCLLIDVKELNYHFNTTQRFSLSEHWVSLCKDAGWIKTAILGKKEIMDTFSEDIITNRGVEFRLFSNEQEAINWLQKKSYQMSI